MQKCHFFVNDGLCVTTSSVRVWVSKNYTTPHQRCFASLNDCIRRVCHLGQHFNHTRIEKDFGRHIRKSFLAVGNLMGTLRITCCRRVDDAAPRLTRQQLPSFSPCNLSTSHHPHLHVFTLWPQHLLLLSFVSILSLEKQMQASKQLSANIKYMCVRMYVCAFVCVSTSVALTWREGSARCKCADLTFTNGPYLMASSRT